MLKDEYMDIPDVESGPEEQETCYPNGFSYQCPLCPGHIDEEDDFEWSLLLEDLICRGCSYDIHNGFVGWADRPEPEQYNHADTMLLLEELTGLTFQQLKYRHMRTKMVEWGGTLPESCSGMEPEGMPDPWLRVVNLRLDSAFMELVAENDRERG